MAVANFSNRHGKRYINILLLSLLFIALIIVSLSLIYYSIMEKYNVYKYVQNSTSLPLTVPSENSSTKSRTSIEEKIKSYISKPNKIVRDKAIEILNSYLNKKYKIYERILYIDAGSYTRIRVDGQHYIGYIITIYVYDTCIIGECDIKVKLENSDYKLIKYYGRDSYFRINISLPDGTYYLVLDNSYSTFTDKKVKITITGYFLRYILNDNIYKIITIALWTANNINYVSDPRGFEYIAPPEETIKTKAGDCDDYAVLLSSMYRNLGLRSAVGLIDVDGDGAAEHAAALVYLDLSKEYIRDRFNAILEVMGIPFKGYSYFKSDTGKGIWLIIDPPMTYGSPEPWYIEHEPYRLVKIIE